MTMLQDEPITAGRIREERNLAAFYRSAEREEWTQQIGAEPKGEWYLIRCELGRDLTAQKWLASRRFGTFLPMNGLKRVLPGWLCAYVFDMHLMQDRILACPGVVGVLRCHKKLPVSVDMKFIRTLAAEAWTGGPLPTDRPKSAAKARKAHNRKLSGRHIKRLGKLKRAMKRADRAGELKRALDIRAQITALRQKFSAPRGVAA
jgi:hypothetical protein